MNLNVDLSSHVYRVKNTIINFVVPLISFLITGAVFVLVLYPSFNDLPEVKAELDDMKTKETLLKSKIANLNRLVDFKPIVDENSVLVDKVLVSDISVPALLTQIDTIASESGLTVTKLSYSLGTEKTIEGDFTYNTISVSLGTDGTFDQLRAFLISVENAARLIDVDSFRYNYVANEVTGDYVTSTFTLVAPYLYVETTAVTDDPLDLDITSPDFISLINKIKGLRYYDPATLQSPPVPVEEAIPETPENAPDTTPVLP